MGLSDRDYMKTGYDEGKHPPVCNCNLCTARRLRKMTQSQTVNYGDAYKLMNDARALENKDNKQKRSVNMGKLVRKLIGSLLMLLGSIGFVNYLIATICCLDLGLGSKIYELLIRISIPLAEYYGDFVLRGFWSGDYYMPIVLTGVSAVVVWIGYKVWNIDSF